MRTRVPMVRALADPGTLLATTHRVDDELRVRLRLVRTLDASRVRDFLEGLSGETRRRRFLHPMPIVSQAVVRGFTHADPRSRLVVAALAPGPDGERMVGLADVALLETGLAELGVVVADEHQEQGVGKLLTEVVAALAVQHGATHLKAELAGDNSAMLALMERLGRTTSTSEHGVSTVFATLSAAAARAA